LLCSALLAFGYAASTTATAPVQGDYFHTGAGARYLQRGALTIDIACTLPWITCPRSISRGGTRLKI
jgi:hypothetical protein